MADVREEIGKFYGTELLQLLQCALPDGNRDGWFGHVLRKTNTAVAPLRHLLLLTALNIELDGFFTATATEQAPRTTAPVGPWPCLNPVCEHRSKLTLNKAEAEPPDSNGTIHLVIRCSLCGFAYLLRDGEEIPQRASHVVDYGSKWKNLLREQWNDTSFTLRGMAKTLGVDPKTVKHRAIDLGLIFPRRGTRLVTTRGVYVPKERKQAERAGENRRAWSEVRAKHPTVGTKALRKLAPAFYARLYRGDQEWLKAHQPDRLSPSVTKVHVDWAQRDEELAGQVATAAHHIKNAPGKPRQVTTTAIGRVMGKQSLFETALARLPLTRVVINHLVESGVDFAVRRVHLAAARLRQSQGSFARWQLVRAPLVCTTASNVIQGLNWPLTTR